MKLTTSTIVLAAAGIFALSANAQIFFDDFSSDTSGTWSNSPIYNSTGGVGGTGGLEFTNDVGVSAQAFSLNVPVSFGVDTDIQVQFDAVELANIAGGVFHLFVTPEGAGQINFFNQEGAIGASYAPLSFDATVPASSTFVQIRFEAVTGGGLGSTSSYEIDNLAVVDPAAVPEPSAAAALLGLAAIGFASVRRRRA